MVTAVETRWDEVLAAPTGLVPSGGWHRPSSRPGVGSASVGRSLRHGVVPHRLRPRRRVRRRRQVGASATWPRTSTVIDLTHGIRPFDVRGGSLALARAISYVAEGVVLAVVDPGVGTSRRAVAIEVAGGAGVLVGPDNGLLAPGRRDRRRRRAGRRAHEPRPPPPGAGRDVRRPRRVRPGRRPPLQRRRPRRAGPARRSRPADAGHGPAATRGVRRDPHRGAVGRPVRQLPAQRRPRRPHARRRRVVRDDRRRAPRRQAGDDVRASSVPARSGSCSTPTACTALGARPALGGRTSCASPTGDAVLLATLDDDGGAADRRSRRRSMLRRDR